MTPSLPPIRVPVPTREDSVTLYQVMKRMVPVTIPGVPFFSYYFFIWLHGLVQLVGSSIFIVTCRIFSCGM